MEAPPRPTRREWRGEASIETEHRYHCLRGSRHIYTTGHLGGLLDVSLAMSLRSGQRMPRFMRASVQLPGIPKTGDGIVGTTPLAHYGT